MKKVLLSAAAALMTLAASAQGISAVGANIEVLPASYWSTKAWDAKVLIVNSGIGYNDNGSGNNTRNGNYNRLVLENEMAVDAAGKFWYEEGYDETTTYESEYIYDDESGDPLIMKWEVKPAPFSNNESYKGMAGTKWCGYSEMSEIFIRRAFTLDPNMLLAGEVYLACGHDDAPCEYYINGVLVFQRTGWEPYASEEEAMDNDYEGIINGWKEGEYVKLTDEQKALIRLGGQENLLAVHVHQNWGGAFADCGLYAKTEGGLPMGYEEMWTGKVLFSGDGSWNGSYNAPFERTDHPWQKLHEALPGDVYTIHLPKAIPATEQWDNQIHFKSPIRIDVNKDYTWKMKMLSDTNIEGLTIKITDNDFDEIELEYQEGVQLAANEVKEIKINFSGQDPVDPEAVVNNFKLAMDFAGAENDDATVTISEMSLVDEDNNELWVGTHYYNYIYTCAPDTVWYVIDDETGEKEFDEDEITYKQIADAVIEGRTETKAWTLPDFDDSMWDDKAMPIGNMNYNPRPNSNWPGHMGHYDCENDGADGHNTNLWVRRTFELDKINERLSYALNVCHDDTYETYVNGHLLQKNTGWTDGTNPVQVHIPAKYLNVGKNVIATYIQQNWGGRFYDCGINVEEVNYDECAAYLKAAIAEAEKDTILTKAMKADIAALVAAAKVELETNKDAAEVKEVGRQLLEDVSAIWAYSPTVQAAFEICNIIRGMKDNGYLAGALADANENLDTCHYASQIDPMIKNMRVAWKRNVAERRTENFVGSQPEIDGEYYFYNVGAKQFLCGAEAWGAHLALNYASNAFRLLGFDQEGDEIEQPDPEHPTVFGVQTFRPNPEGNEGIGDFMGWNGYVDIGQLNKWEFIPVEGKKNVFNIVQYGQTNAATGGLKYLGLRDGDNALAIGNTNQHNVVDTDMRTAELETNQWMLISKDELDAIAKKGTAENPADLTYLIQNPGFDQRLARDRWEGNGSFWGRGGNYVDFVLEGWNTGNDYIVSQTIVSDVEEALLVPGGCYTVGVQAYYRDGHCTTHMDNYLAGEPTNNFGYLFASFGEEDSEEITVVLDQLTPYHEMANKTPGVNCGGGGNKYGVPDACWAAAENFFQFGLCWNYVSFQLPKNWDGTLAIGVKKIVPVGEESKQGDWLVCDNFRLKFHGMDPNAIENIGSDEAQQKGETIIYNIAGQRLTRLQKGINILNGKKVVIK